MPITRTFTIAELRALELPPEDPDKPEYFPDHILADEPVSILKYTQLRRCVFEDEDGDTWAVKYETRIDMGDYEVDEYSPDDHGWYGNTVEATKVEERQVTVTKWLPIEEEES